LTAIKNGSRASTSSPWEQFGLRHAVGNWGNNKNKKESAEAKKKRLKGTANNMRRKKEKKR
jgi:hypothetical protein